MRKYMYCPYLDKNFNGEDWGEEVIKVIQNLKYNKK